jgi:hypothetical protein
MAKFDPWPVIKNGLRWHAPQQLTEQELEMLIRRWTPFWRTEHIRSLIKSIIAKQWVEYTGAGWYKNLLYEAPKKEETPEVSESPAKEDEQ